MLQNGEIRINYIWLKFYGLQANISFLRKKTIKPPDISFSSSLYLMK